ncbi:hypothetical protein F9C07_2227595 [Aspergillus flavus]|uniref:F-box domain-containing protein n=1 Tax=Aspergillus flavus (strain ATCC 200026 / FGSC A1120 / IAM 13836 / NRRL 3357 / JCM 12722 / SRRC 167) TaxID=332952 RepID=A0A7U2MQ39_ASPFN|nr:hypothetical protein AFLA_003526 [Aspergillus flavus NRRL3357]KAJ1705689.1 hypothetical protein NYO67_12166 [Aspergillus flavus]QRD87765.1 hypothetical protein F9C07_2227595 [Aspergillus flavus]
MATIESLPTEIIDMIVSYVVHDEFNEGRILKNLRLVNRPMFKSASRLLFRHLRFSQESFPTSSDLDKRFHLEEGYQPASSDYVRHLYIYIGGKRRNQDQADATLKLDEDGMRDSFRSFFKRLPNLRRFDIHQ